MKFSQNLTQLLIEKKNNLEVLEKYKHLLSPNQQLKYKIISDYLNFFQQYPTLYTLRFAYYSDNDFKGWKPCHIGVGWDTAENIKKNQTDNSSCFNVYVNNTMNSQKWNEMLIPSPNGLTSWMNIYHEVKEKFDYLNHENNHFFIREMVLEKKSSMAAFGFHTYNDYGHFNFNLIDEVESWLGKDLIAEFRYLELDNKLDKSIKKNNLKKI